MGCEINFDQATGQISLAGELTIYTTKEIRNRLIEFMALADNIEIDLANITEIDTAGLQLMLLAKNKPGKDVSFVHHSPAVLRLVDLANLGQTLGDPLYIAHGADHALFH